MDIMTLATVRSTYREYPNRRRDYRPTPAPALWGGGRPPRPPKQTAAAASGGDSWDPEDWKQDLYKEIPGGWDYT